MRRILPLALCAILAGVIACQEKPVAGASPDTNKAEAVAFLEKNKTVEGVQTTASGLQYRIDREGPEGGVHPKRTDEVRVHYEGKLLDGYVFDSSYERGVPSMFVLGRVVPGWTEGIQLMTPGDEFTFWIPPELGYGDRGAGGEIPPNALLTFRVELIDFLPAL